MSAPLMWAGLPVSLRLVQPRYQVVVDAVGIGEVFEVVDRLWRWKHYETGTDGSAVSRRAACTALLDRHSRMVAEFAESPE